MPDYLTETRGLRSWLFTLDHKRIGVMYFWSTLAAFALGGVFAMIIRLSLLSPKQTIISAETYDKLFTLHGAVMIFVFIIPSIPAAFGNFVLPLMLGAKDVAFPRLNLASYYVYVAGTLILLGGMLTGGIDTGWTFYTPYSSTTGGSVTLMTFGIFVLGFSSVFTGINFVATIHKLRAPGMGWYQMPLFAWGIYATAIIQILATPVLAITLVLLIMERVFQVGIFDAKLGGDPILFQHFFWFYSHPAVYIMILPGMAIISEVIPVFSRKTIFGYKAIAYSSLAIAFVSFLVWGHHMFVSGQSQLAAVIFSFLTFLVAIPSGVKIFNWLATMYRGSISLQAPMIYAIMFLVLFAIGGLTGLFLGALAVDVRSARHLLRRSALSLRDDGRHFHRIPGRPALLVAQDVWPHVLGETGAPGGRADLRRFQPDVPHAVPSGQPGNAAALCPLPAAVPASASPVDHRELGAGAGPADRPGLSGGVSAQETRCPRQPLGWSHLRVGDLFPAANPQLRTHPRADTRPL